jgi:hypothetical protein
MQPLENTRVVELMERTDGPETGKNGLKKRKQDTRAMPPPVQLNLFKEDHTLRNGVYVTILTRYATFNAFKLNKKQVKAYLLRGYPPHVQNIVNSGVCGNETRRLTMNHIKEIIKDIKEHCYTKPRTRRTKPRVPIPVAIPIDIPVAIPIPPLDV